MCGINGRKQLLKGVLTGFGLLLIFLIILSTIQTTCVIQASNIITETEPVYDYTNVIETEKQFLCTYYTIDTILGVKFHEELIRNVYENATEIKDTGNFLFDEYVLTFTYFDESTLSNKSETIYNVNEYGVVERYWVETGSTTTTVKEMTGCKITNETKQLVEVDCSLLHEIFSVFE